MSGASSAFDKIAGIAETPIEATAMPGRPGAHAATIKGYGQGNLGLALVGGVLGAAAGGVAWVALSTVTGWQLSLFAIVVGGLVGFGVGQGNGGRGGMGAGMIGAVFALVGVLGAQATLTYFALEDARKQSSVITEADVLDHMAWGVYEELESNGVAMTANDDGWPAEVLAESARRWEEMTPADQRAYKATLRGDADSAMEHASVASYAVAYLWSSGWFGLVCVALSVSTAWKISARDVMEVARSRNMIPSNAAAAVIPQGSGSGFRGLPTAVASGGAMKVESTVKPQAASAPAPAPGAAPAPAPIATPTTVSALPTHDVLASIPDPAESAAPAPPKSLGMLSRMRQAEDGGAGQKEAA